MITKIETVMLNNVELKKKTPKQFYLDSSLK